MILAMACPRGDFAVTLTRFQQFDSFWYGPSLNVETDQRECW